MTHKSGPELGDSIILESILGSFTDMAVAATDLGFRILYFNPAAEEIFGYKAEDVIGRTVMEVHKNVHVDHARFQHAVDTVKEEGEYRYTIEKILENGSRFIDSRITGIWGEHKKLIGFVLKSQDITARKLNEEKIKQISYEWETTFNSINDFVSIHDRDFRIVRANRALLDAVHMNNSGIAGRRCYEVFHSASEPLPECPHRKAMKLKKPVMEEFFEPVMGVYLQVSAFPVIDEAGEVLGSVHIAKDISERKRAEEELRTSQERYKMSTKAAKVGVWDWDIRTNSFYLDPVIKAVLGYTDEEIPNDIEVWTTYVHPDDLEPVMKAARDCIEGKTPEYFFEHRMIHKDGSVRWILVRGKVILDENGEAVRMVGTDVDITDRKRVENELQDAKNELEVKVKERTAELELVVKRLQEEIGERRHIENELMEAQKKLKVRADELAESNAALKVLLTQREKDQKEFENNILSNIKHLIMPYLEKLKRNRAVPDELVNLNIIESNLKEIVSPFSAKLSYQYMSFTPKEIMVADLIKDGKQDKEIMEILNISLGTVKTHRRSIRKKLGITREKVNLRTRLLSLSK